MKALLISLFTVLLFTRAHAQARDEIRIRQIMSKQEYDWNKGDIDAFMQAYWKSDSLLFIGSNGVNRGWHTTLAHYKKSYPDTAVMGKLRFENLELKRLAHDCYFVLGKWQLMRTGGNAGGYYTLIFQKIKEQWYIVADHSS